MSTALKRRLIFHADDFGMSAAINQGIIRGFRAGLLTSTSLLANAPFADSAVRDWSLLADQYSELPSKTVRRELDDADLPFDLGIHLNLTQGQPLTGEKYPRELLDIQGQFPGITRLFARLSRSHAAELNRINQELEAQIEWMCDRGLQPSHLNGHQYVELIPQIGEMIEGLLVRYSIPVVRVAYEPDLVRNVLATRGVVTWGLAMIKQNYAGRFRKRIQQANIVFPDRYFGTSHAGRIDYSTFLRFIREPFNAMTTEIGMHPAAAPDSDEDSIGAWRDPLARSRPIELKWLVGHEVVDEMKKRGLSLGRLRSLCKAER